MKRIVATSLLCLAFFACDSGKDIPALEVPSIVVNALKAEFTETTDLEWETFGEHYKAEFEVANVDHTALIASNGTILKYKHEMNITDLPQEVVQAIGQNYPKEKIEDAYMLEVDDATFYEVEFESWLTDNYKVFTVSGTENKNSAHWD